VSWAKASGGHRCKQRLLASGPSNGAICLADIKERREIDMTKAKLLKAVLLGTVLALVLSLGAGTLQMASPAKAA